MTNLKGTEKQVKWAEDIIAIYEDRLNELKEVIKEKAKEEKLEETLNKVDNVLAELNKIEDAGEIIEKFKEISLEKAQDAQISLMQKSIKENFEISISIKYFKELKNKIFDEMEEAGIY